MPTYIVPKLENYSPATLDKAVEELKTALAAEAGVSDPEAKRVLRDRWLARKSGILTQINDLWLKAAPPEAKREVGRRVNEVKAHVESCIEQIQQEPTVSAARPDRLDVTLPGIRRPLGAEHPVIKTSNEMVGIFKAMGYSVAEGPEIETDYYNFESLNFPPNHPARDTQDTLFVAGQE